MAPEKTPKTAGRSMTPVYTTVPVAGGAQRDPQGGTVYPSGRTLLNTNGHEMWVQLVTGAGLDPDTVKARFAVDKPNAIAGAYPIPGGVPGATQVRQYDPTSTSLHLGGVFKDHPELRPKGKRQVTIGIETDSDGHDFLAIDLQTPMVKRTTSRDSSDASNKPKKAQTKQAPEPAAKAEGEANPDSTSAT